MAIVPEIYYQYTSGGVTLNVLIRCIETTTGNPVDGNLNVTYEEFTDGVSSGPQTAYVPGQSIVIWFGLADDASNKSWIITGYEAAGPQPPVASCDLLIANVIVNTPESSPGANNASIAVNATSSYGPIEYSLNDIDYQTSPIFTGLSGGLKTVYVTDANTLGCSQSQSFNIPTLTNLLVSDPGVVLGGNTSRWNAAFNPIVFTYQRQDFAVNAASLYNVGGVTGTTLAVNGDMSVLVALAAANVIAGVNATSFYIYVNTAAYVGVYKVITATTNSVTIDETFTVTTVGFINSDNIRPYYKIITKITTVDPSTGRSSTVQSLNRSNQAGEIKADISSYLQSLLRAFSTSDYTQVNFRDDNLSASYRIAYAESWADETDSGYTSDFIELAPTYYVTYSARQLGQRYGGNLAEFVPFPNLPAKWVTDFATPAYSLTFPFDLSFIYSEALAGYQLYYKITPLDINQNLLPTQVLTSYLLNEDRSYLLNTDGSRLIISTTNLGNTPIVEHVGLNRLLIDFDFDDIVYYFKVGIYYNDETDTSIQVLSDQLVRVDKNCDYNSVYLRWIGISGAWNYYRFIFNQEVTLDVQNATIIQNYVSDWENQEGIEEVVTKSAGQKMQVHAEDMSVSDIKGCQSIKYSPKVQMLMSNSPIKWQTIVVNSATFTEYDTNNPTGAFAITFNMPSINIQSQ